MDHRIRLAAGPPDRMQTRARNLDFARSQEEHRRRQMLGGVDHPVDSEDLLRPSNPHVIGLRKAEMRESSAKFRARSRRQSGAAAAAMQIETQRGTPPS